MTAPVRPPLRALFIGFGHVGRRVAAILGRERSGYPGLAEFDLQVMGIVTRHGGSLADPAGVDLDRAEAEMSRDGAFAADHPARVVLDGPTAVATLDYDVLVELSTLSIPARGEPAVSHVREALRRGRHVVSANKGPVAFAGRELRSLARERGVTFFHESAVMDGAPVFSLAARTLPGCRVQGVSGILNSTTNFILGRLEAGGNMSEAIRDAQAAGFAEADPSTDLEGWDAAAKIAVLANTLMEADLTPLDVERTGITGVTAGEATAEVNAGRHLKLVARAWREGMAVRARVAVEGVPANHHFAAVTGTGSVVRIETDLMAPLLITQENPTLTDTAYGVIADLLRVDESRRQGDRI